MRPGATIAVVAPAGPVDPSALRPGIRALESLGYEVVLGGHIYEKKAYLAGKDSQRVKDLNEAIRDPEVDAIICARGGYGSMRLLEGVEYDTFLRRPKIIVGFSDITALLHALYQKCGVITFHGPMVGNVKERDDANFLALIKIISANEPWEMTLEGAKVLRTGSAHGRIIGGNLSIITSLIGSPYFPEVKDCLLFLEDTNEPLYRIDRMLTSLRLKGVFAGVNAVVAGEFHSCCEEQGLCELVMEVVGDLEIPVVLGAPFGHGANNFPFPIGSQAVLDTEGFSIRSLDSPVS